MVSEEFPVTQEGTTLPIKNLRITLADGTVVIPSFDSRRTGMPASGVDTARFSSVQYSEDIVSVSYELQSGASISPLPPVITDSVTVDTYGGVQDRRRVYWGRDDSYAISGSGTDYKVVFLLDDYIRATEAETAEPSVDGALFYDLFNEGDVPSTDKWSLCTAGTSTWNKYFGNVDGYENVRVEGGYLKLTASKGSDGLYRTGGIRSTYYTPLNSRTEVKAKLSHKVRGGFPAIWQMPDNKTIGWPVTGEIDIMEWIQGAPNVVYHTIHRSLSGVTGQDDSNHSTSATDVTQWHVYAVDRTEEAIVMYVDGVETFRFANPGSDDRNYYPFSVYGYDIILNFSLGGSSSDWPGLIYDSDLPGEMWVDYVVVTEL